MRIADAADARGLVVSSEGGSRCSDDGVVAWHAELDPGAEWSTCVELLAVRGGEVVASRYPCGVAPASAVPTERQAAWARRLPTLDTDVPGLLGAFGRTGEDLGALRLFDPHHPDEPLVVAGAPWFMTLFGRDSILTSLMALLLDPTLALGTARALARLQGTRVDPATEEEPGRILHEVRYSSGASLALADGDVYYGSVDATPLFVVLVAELHRWGCAIDDLRPLLPAVDAALAWMQGHGDRDGDGWLEYAPSFPGSLANQGWKDSGDGISFADGRMPAGPHRACARSRGTPTPPGAAGAALARAAGDAATGAARDARADDLAGRFDQDFWMPEAGAYALALDGDKRQVDAVASNQGHCLWSGIVQDHEKAAAVARWLVSPELATGWGIRTLATSMTLYNPLSYHNGSVWPHDTALCVAGLRRAGFVDEAVQIATDLLAAAAAAGGRLPELFAGLTTAEFPGPVPYPASCSPQAWASAAPLLLLRAFLGWEPDLPVGHAGAEAGAAGRGAPPDPLRRSVGGRTRHDRGRRRRRRGVGPPAGRGSRPPGLNSESAAAHADALRALVGLPSVCRDGATMTSARWNSLIVAYPQVAIEVLQRADQVQRAVVLVRGARAGSRAGTRSG